MGVGGNQSVVWGVVPEALGLGCDASCRHWGSPTPTKVQNLLPPEPPHVS